jgi:hypothetical protein
MKETYIIGILGFIGLGIVWIIVQAFWRKTFSDQIEEDDVLAARGNCTGCGCMGGVCKDIKKPITQNK